MHKLKSSINIEQNELKSEVFLLILSLFAIFLLLVIHAELRRFWGFDLLSDTKAPLSEAARLFLGIVPLYLIILSLPGDAAEQKHFLLAWTIKIFTSLVLYLPYEAHYGKQLDAFSYFAKAVNNMATQHGIYWQNIGSDLITDLCRSAFEMFFVSYSMTKIWFSFLGFLGTILFFKALTRIICRHHIAYFYILALWPGLLFWTSGISKDAVVYLATGVYAYGIALLLTRRPLTGGAIAFTGLIFAGAIRYWMILVMVLPLACVTLNEVFCKPRTPRQKYFFFAVLSVLALALYFLFIKKNIIFQNMSLLEITNDLAQRFKRGQSQTGSPEYFRSLADIFAYVPTGAFASLFRPLPGEVKNAFGYLAGFESLLLVMITILIGLCLQTKQIFNNIFTWLASYLFWWVSIYAFISPHNLGTGIRYKIQATPFLIIFAAYILHQKNFSFKSIPFRNFSETKK